MSSELADAFEELLDVQEEVMDERVKCKIAGKEYDFLVGNEDVGVEFGTGGEDRSGTITGQLRRSDFPNGLPEKFSTFEYDGELLQVLDSKPINRNSTIEIIAGDPAADDA